MCVDSRSIGDNWERWHNNLSSLLGPNEWLSLTFDFKPEKVLNVL